MSARLPDPLRHSSDSSPTGTGVATAMGVCGVTSWVKSSGPSWRSLWGRLRAAVYAMQHTGCAGTLLSPVVELQATNRQVPSLLPAKSAHGRTCSVLGRGFSSCYMSQLWQRRVRSCWSRDVGS